MSDLLKKSRLSWRAEALRLAVTWASFGGAIYLTFWTPLWLQELRSDNLATHTVAISLMGLAAVVSLVVMYRPARRLDLLLGAWGCFIAGATLTSASWWTERWAVNTRVELDQPVLGVAMLLVCAAFAVAYASGCHETAKLWRDGVDAGGTGDMDLEAPVLDAGASSTTKTAAEDDQPTIADEGGEGTRTRPSRLRAVPGLTRSMEVVSSDEEDGDE